jgi:hypothetical protein
MSKLTIAKTDAGTIRCTGRLFCACGEPVQAIDFLLDKDDDDISLRLICSGCHVDLLEIEPC